MRQNFGFVQRSLVVSFMVVNFFETFRCISVLMCASGVNLDTGELRLSDLYSFFSRNVQHTLPGHIGV